MLVEGRTRRKGDGSIAKKNTFSQNGISDCVCCGCAGKVNGCVRFDLNTWQIYFYSVRKNFKDRSYAHDRTCVVTLRMCIGSNGRKKNTTLKGNVIFLGCIVDAHTIIIGIMLRNSRCLSPRLLFWPLKYFNTFVFSIIRQWWKNI